MWHSLIALALLAHGVGHVLFLGNAWGYWRAAEGRSWLVGGLVAGSQAAEGAFGLLFLLPLVGFVAVAWAFWTGQPPWRSWALAMAALSSVLVLLAWGGLNPSSAVFALLFNAALAATVLWQGRPDAALGA